MILHIQRNVCGAMVAAARRAAPLEACGLLAGNDDRAVACYELPNADASAEHYSMRPEDQFAAVKAMRARGHQMLAIWHSHPATPARMSDEDLRLAYTPGVVHVIVSLAGGLDPTMRGFLVADGVPSEVPIMIQEENR